MAFRPIEKTQVTYTLSFDMQWVKGSRKSWQFLNENSGGGPSHPAPQGVNPGFNFPAVVYPGDCRWRHYEFTKEVGVVPANVLIFVFQGGPSGPIPPQVMRIANVTLRVAAPHTPQTHDGPLAGTVEGGGCCSRN